MLLKYLYDDDGIISQKPNAFSTKKIFPQKKNMQEYIYIFVLSLSSQPYSNSKSFFTLLKKKNTHTTLQVGFELEATSTGDKSPAP